MTDLTDFGAAFNAVPSALLLLKPDPAFTIVAATDAYLSATGTSRADIVGRALFEVFPDNPADPLADGTRNLRRSLTRVRGDRIADTMPVQRYDIPRRRSTVFEFEERYWAPHNAPVFDGSASVARIIHRVEDVTAGVVGRRSSHEATPWRDHVRVERRSDLTLLRQAIREVYESAMIDGRDLQDLLVAASELGANMVVHAGGGDVEVETVCFEAPNGIRLRFRDRGPGIADLGKALKGGHSTAGTLGRGLSGSRKLVDDFQIDSGEHGTVITVTKWCRPRTRRVRG